MKYYDVTMKISPSIQVYKNDPAKIPVFENANNHDIGTTHETVIKMNVHTGTHLDFPLHMIKNGKTSNTYDFKKYIREVKVFDLTHVKEEIALDDIKDLDIKRHDFVFFKTQNSFEDTFNFKFVFVREDAAKYLSEVGIDGVGVDGLGIERDQKGHPTHLYLMHQDIDIIEGLRLKDIKPGTYMMYGQAIPLEGLDACPMSIVLASDD